MRTASDLSESQGVFRPLPPGPVGWQRARDVAGFFHHPLEVLTRGRRRYGDLVSYYAGPLRLIVLHDPEAIHHVLVANFRNYHKSPTYRGLQLVLGNGLVNSEGELWRRQRKLAQPAFHHRRLRGFADQMVRCTADMLDAWGRKPSPRQLDVHDEMLALTMRTVGHTLFSTELGNAASNVRPALEIALARANREVEAFLPLPRWLPTFGNLRFGRAMRTLDGIVYAMIDERRRDSGEREDLLSMLIAATDESGDEGMSNEQLRDEVMTLFLAGHETVANALSWTWWCLAQHPELQERLVEELDRVLGDRDPCFEDLPRLQYTGQVLDEVMRLYPPAWIVERQALGEDEVGPYRIPARCLVSIPTFTVHRHPDHWTDPERFDPERFAPGNEKNRPRYAYFPFGAGPRTCIGNAFALMEGKLMIAMIARRYNFEVLPGQRVRADPGVTLRPRGGLRLVVRRR